MTVVIAFGLVHYFDAHGAFVFSVDAGRVRRQAIVDLHCGRIDGVTMLSIVTALVGPP